MPKLLLILLLFCATQTAAAAQSVWNTEADYNFKTRILATHTTIPHNNPIQTLIEFDLKNWKIYGQNPGSTGLPTSFTIEPSDNIEKYEIIYPPTETLNILETQTNGYQKHVAFPINITAKDPQSPVTINATANFLACDTLCIPTTHKFTLTLQPTPPQQTAEINPIANQIYQKYINPSPISGQQNIWIIIIFFSVIGGLILNIMPCVLPAIGLKAFAISNHPDKISVRKNCLATAAGIITCFTILGIALITIKFFGAEIGWGIQYQQPAFLSLLFMVMIIFSAALMEWIPTLPTLPGLPALSTANSSTLKQDFMLGALATVLATPCSAPFLSTAVGAAMIVGGFEAFLIFLGLGFGMSLPYLLMAVVPQAARIIPKPGRWMVAVKTVLAFLLLLTGIWLLWLLSSTHSVMIAAIVGLMGLASVGYLYLRKQDILVFKTPTALLPTVLVVAAFLLGFSPVPSALPPQISTNIDYKQETWQNFDETEINRLVSEGKIVIVDVTADWCVTCQFNKFRVFKNDKIAGLLSSEDIVPMRADWTLPDDSITRYLRKHNRVGVPMNVIYGPAAPEGLVLPEILSVEAVLSALTQAGG